MDNSIDCGEGLIDNTLGDANLLDIAVSQSFAQP